LWEELSYHEEIEEESSTTKAKKQNTARRPSPSWTENATTFGLPKQAPPFLVVAASRKLAVGDIPKDAIPPPPFVDDRSPLAIGVELPSGNNDGSKQPDVLQTKSRQLVLVQVRDEPSANKLAVGDITKDAIPPPPFVDDGSPTVIRGELPSQNIAGSQPPDIFKSRQLIVRDEPLATSASLLVLGNGRQQLQRDLPTISVTNEEGRPFMTPSSPCKVQPVESSTPPSLTQTMQQPRQSIIAGCWMGCILFWWTILLLAIFSMWLCERIEFELKVYQCQQELANCQALDDPFYIHDLKEQVRYWKHQTKGMQAALLEGYQSLES
jgi:hypothetical protein